eukprot:766482-Hanusia_phi.AAC.1
MASANTSRVRVITTFNQFESGASSRHARGLWVEVTRICFSRFSNVGHQLCGCNSLHCPGQSVHSHCFACNNLSSLTNIFFAPQGCPHCNRFLPQYNSISIEVCNACLRRMMLMANASVASMEQYLFLQCKYHERRWAGDRKVVFLCPAQVRKVDAGADETTWPGSHTPPSILPNPFVRSVSEFRKLLAKHLQDRTFVGAGWLPRAPPTSPDDPQDTSWDQAATQSPPEPWGAPVKRMPTSWRLADASSPVL